MTQKMILLASMVVFGVQNASAKSTKASEKNLVCAKFEKIIQTGGSEQKLKQFLKFDWENKMNQSPEWATYIGFPGHDHLWSDRSLEGIHRQHQETVCELKSLLKISKKGLSTQSRLNYELLQHDLEMAVRSQEFHGEYLQMSHLEGLQMDVADIMMAAPQNQIKDYENRLSRLEKVPELVDQVIVLLKEGLKNKITPYQMFLMKVPNQFERVLTADHAKSPLYESFLEMPSSIPESEKQELQKKALQVISEKVYPALEKLKAFVVTQYIPGCRQDISLSSLPKGKEWYEYMIEMHTTTKKSAAELHELGLQEVARISLEMESLKKQVGYSGSLKDFNQYLLTDKKFYFENSQELLAGYREIAKRIDPGLAGLFKNLPRLPYGVREMPAYKAKEAPAAYYDGGSMQSGRAGYFTANTENVASRKKWQMEALTLHEAMPGHHLQISLAQEISDLPEFRKYLGFTAFVEGWGLYAESLGSDLGLYKDPYSKYGQLSYEMWRAIRLVVDTGIHSKGWSRDQALQYFKDNVAKSQSEMEVEVDRYITWPGQALAYKVGELKFKELKLRAQQKLGSKFDIREFHDELLKYGSLPMDLVEKNIDAWIAKK